MTKHVLKGSPAAPCDCHKDEHRLSCNICDGGLALCVVCGGAEGSMPTDCPGVALAGSTLEAIYAGTTDFRDGEWINPGELADAKRDAQIADLSRDDEL